MLVDWYLQRQKKSTKANLCLGPFWCTKGTSINFCTFWTYTFNRRVSNGLQDTWLVQFQSGIQMLMWTHSVPVQVFKTLPKKQNKNIQKSHKTDLVTSIQLGNCLVFRCHFYIELFANFNGINQINTRLLQYLHPQCIQM